MEYIVIYRSTCNKNDRKIYPTNMNTFSLYHLLFSLPDKWHTLCTTKQKLYLFDFLDLSRCTAITLK